MRYVAVENITFTDWDGKKIVVKDMRKYPDYITAFSMNVQDTDRIDEIATRQDIYGRDSEMDVYKIFDHNRVSIVDNRYSLNKKLKIPV